MPSPSPESATSQVRRLIAHIDNPTPLQQSVIDRAFSIALGLDRKSRAAAQSDLEASRQKERQDSLARTLAILGCTTESKKAGMQ